MQIYSHTGIRGIAAMSVFMAHIYVGHNSSWGLSHSTFSIFLCKGYPVDLFFILSGFILNWVYLNGDKSVNWPLYFQARVARIAPLYYLTTILMFPIFIYSLVKYGSVYVGKYYLMTLVLNAIMFSGVIDGFNCTMNDPAWSISVEIFCYLFIFPILVYLTRFLKDNKIAVIISILLVCFFTRCLVLCYRMPTISIDQWHWNSSWLARGVFAFSVGFFVCVLYKHTLHLKMQWYVDNIVIFASILLLILTQYMHVPMHWLLYAFPFLAYFTAFDRGIFARMLKWNPLQWLGERSYSIYLWHYPILVYYTDFLRRKESQLLNSHFNGFINCVIVIFIVLITSEISFRYFEIPCQKLIKNFTSRQSQV